MIKEAPFGVLVRWLLAVLLLGLCAFACTVAGGAFNQVAPIRFERDATWLMQRQTASPAALTQIEDVTRKSLAQRPLDGSAWLRLAYISSLRAGRLDDDANRDIENSYITDPLGSEVTMWRLAFIFDNWPTASKSVRTRVLAEMAAVYPRRGWDIDSLVSTVRNPTGRMIATVSTRRLRVIEENRRPLAQAGREGAAWR